MADKPATNTAPVGDVPLDWLPGLKQNFKFDIMSGFILFLIALPLSLAIASASGVPAVAGLITAICGGIIGSLLGGSYVTINGPAAGLIVIVLGCFTAMSELAGGDPILAYQYLLAVGVVAGLIQIVLGLVKAGPMTNVFPFSVVEGMVAGIGIIVLTKQFHVMLNRPVPSSDPHGAPASMLDTFAAIPGNIVTMVPQSAIVGGVAVLLMLFWPKIAGKLAKFIPAPLVIVALTIPMAAYFNAGAEMAPAPAPVVVEHTAEPAAGDAAVVEHTPAVAAPAAPALPVKLVKVPTDFSMVFTFPNFDQITNAASILFIVTFVLVASLESLLTASAIEKKDPWKRRNNMNREFWSKGVANTVACALGGIPMIAEVVRSSTNVMVGARTRWSNFFHGAFILVALAFLPWMLNMIPVAALAGMLCVIGFRLAHPKIFAHVQHTGTDELVFMVVTVMGVVFVDLLVGVFLGMWVAIALNGVRAGNTNRFGSAPLFLLIHTAFLAAVLYFVFFAHNELVAIGFMIVDVFIGVLSFKTGMQVTTTGDSVRVNFTGPVVFTSLITVRNTLDKLPPGKNVHLDMSQAGLIDHSVRDKLSDIADEYARETGGTLTVTGIHSHTATNHHALATLVPAR
jgi:MFS superfamily sulfate permease-like transporter